MEQVKKGLTVSYEDLYTEIQNNLFQLRMRVKRRRRAFVKNGGNWGDVGDLGRINADIKNILEYLK